MSVHKLYQSCKLRAPICNEKELTRVQAQATVSPHSRVQAQATAH